MELKALSATEVVTHVIERTGLSPDADLLCVESLAWLIRYEASLACPVSTRGLVSAVVDVLQPIVSSNDLRERCKNVLEELINQGDLIEFEEVNGWSKNRLLYRAPPCFVCINETRCLVIGVAPDGIDPIPPYLTTEFKGVHRILNSDDQQKLAQALLHAGLHKLPYSTWAKAPNTKRDTAVLHQFNDILDRQVPASDTLDGLNVLNTAKPVAWYRARWENSGTLTGRYVATRPQRYGADLWCYVELLDGKPKRLVDLPVGMTVERACDQAWRLQCALDAKAGNPQTYKLEDIDDAKVRLTIHLPCPSWLLRRWDCTGQRAKEGVFVFEFDETQVMAETNILEKELWMEQEA